MLKLPQAQDYSQWYTFIRQIYADIRGSAFKARTARLENLNNLFAAFRKIHEDYVEIFTKFRNHLVGTDASSEIHEAKSVFLQSREENTKGRAVLAIDIFALKGVVVTPEEQEFLQALANYLSRRQSPGGGFASFSLDFWQRIRSENSKEELLSEASMAISDISDAFSKVVEAYSKLDSSFRLG